MGKCKLCPHMVARTKGGEIDPFRERHVIAANHHLIWEGLRECRRVLFDPLINQSDVFKQPT